MADPEKNTAPAGGEGPRSIHDRWADDETPVKVLRPPTAADPSPDAEQASDVPAGVSERHQDLDWGLGGGRTDEDEDIDLGMFKPE